jgi:uncharacterized membrane-anchored protein YhcB (DUF1043 family)
MFGEISLLTWLASAIVFAVGGSAGFFIARQIKDKRTLELEKQLEATQSKLTQYQDDVNNHFLKTSLLFNKLTDNYREVYEHLATGAQKLCNDKPLTRALDLPETKILAAGAATTTAQAEQNESEKNAQTTHTTEQHTDEHDDSEHLGVETTGASEAFASANAETESSEDTTAAETIQAKETVAETTNSETETTNAATADETPTISEAELKTLEANEKKKSEEEEVHLGAESTPGVEPEFHKTHPSIH